MPGPPPKLTRRRRNKPLGGEWQHAPAVGWRWGPVPDPPDGLRPETEQAWHLWFGGWVAAFWYPGDVPGLEILARVYDMLLERPTVRGSRELMAWLNRYGLTPKAQQLRRWLPPEASEE
jgi:hypothetical protein